MTTPFGQHELQSLRRDFEQLAIEAGRIILQIRKSGIVPHEKADSTPVTAADVQAEQAICRGLRSRVPALPIVAEEASAEGRTSKTPGATFILIDPLDGTREFIAGRDEFTVNIALIQNGEPILGAVLAPACRLLYSAHSGHAERIDLGADCAPLARRPAQTRPMQSPPGILASRSHRTGETDRFLSRFPDAQVQATGSSLKFCLIAEGLADLYPRFGPTMEWDTAAGDAILRSAGGMVRTEDGRPLTYGKTGQMDRPDYANPPFIAAGSADPIRW